MSNLINSLLRDLGYSVPKEPNAEQCDMLLEVGEKALKMLEVGRRPAPYTKADHKILGAVQFTLLHSNQHFSQAIVDQDIVHTFAFILESCCRAAYVLARSHYTEVTHGTEDTE